MVKVDKNSSIYCTNLKYIKYYVINYFIIKIKLIIYKYNKYTLL